MIKGETIRSGAPETCPTCKAQAKWDVYVSGAGYYVGTYCQCGPYTRESVYYPTRRHAQHAWDTKSVLWR